MRNVICDGRGGSDKLFYAYIKKFTEVKQYKQTQMKYIWLWIVIWMDHKLPQYSMPVSISRYNPVWRLFEAFFLFK